MSGSKRAAIGIDRVASLLGEIQVPGSIDDLARALLQRFPNAIRLRPELSAADLPFATAPVDWYRLGRRVIDRSAKPTRYLAYAAGDYYVQDAGSLLALAAAGTATSTMSGKLICDLCAAPGGKATALVEAIGDEGFVLANEVIGSRLGALQLNLARTGSDRYAVSNLDPDKLADQLGGQFDLVLVDAPCSGQAMLGSGKQKTASLSAKQIGHCALRQQRILDAAIRLVRSGGRLVYSTCTFAEAENEAQISRLVQAESAIPDPVGALGDFQSTEACYRLWPHRHNCAGAFAASLRVSRSPIEHNEDHPTPTHSVALPGDLDVWFNDWRQQMRVRQRDSVIYGWPSDVPAWVDALAVAGPELAHRVGRTWKPAHAAALRRVQRARATQVTDIDDQQAKAFVRGESIRCSGKGWTVVQWRGRPVGWVKVNGSVGKNHLPKPARLQGDLVV